MRELCGVIAPPGLRILYAEPFCYCPSTIVLLGPDVNDFAVFGVNSAMKIRTLENAQRIAAAEVASPGAGLGLGLRTGAGDGLEQDWAQTTLDWLASEGL
ncbi:hypothetical protein [Arthrobacter polaris]|uniref:hypothetical protein n=1 Tax=Arthrobacter polaris TaxID=2813727 RepID=UPI001F1A075B|nr:hypothetical protein [Arthrobacter polaris]UIK88283.1 hypothetical protein J0916_12850 [Arthrobacter polaris]